MKWHSRVFLIVAFVFYANCMRHVQRTCPLNHRPPNMLMIRKPVGDGAEQMNNPRYSYHALLCIVSQTKHCIHISPCNSHQCIFWNNIQKYSRMQGFPSLEIKELKKTLNFLIRIKSSTFSSWYFHVRFLEYYHSFDSYFTEFLSKCLIDYNSALVHAMTWGRIGAKPLP